jgi:hypothetical protein
MLMTGSLAGALLVAMPVASVTADTLPGPWTASLSQSDACAPSTATAFTFSFTNTGNLAIGRAFLLAPTGFAVLPGTGYTVNGGGAYGGRDVIEVTGGPVAIGASRSVTIGVAITAGAGPASWVAEAESGNDYFDNDPDHPDDDFALVGQQPVTTVHTGCNLVFTAQPADAGKDKTITSANLNDAGAPIALEVHDSGNLLVPVAASVSLDLLRNGAPAPGLTPGVPNVGSGSITLAPQVSVPIATKAYTLRVSPTDGAIAGATSTAFQIWDAAKACAVDCTLTTGGTTNSFTVSPTAPQSGAGLGATVNAVNLDCSALKYGAFSPIPGTQTFGWTYTAGGFKTETILVGKSLLTTKLLLAKALIYQVCYSSPTQFVTYFGLKAQPDPVVSAAMGQQFYTGILRPCLSSDPNSALAQQRAPCVLSRQWTSAGEVVKILSEPGDPYSR